MFFKFRNNTQILTRCDFFLNYPGAENIMNGTDKLYSIYLQRNVFVAQPQVLADGLAQIWTNQNLDILSGATLLIQLQNQLQYVCSEGYRTKF